ILKSGFKSRMREAEQGQEEAFRALADEIAKGIARGHHAEARVRQTRHLEVLTPSSLGILCFRARPRPGMTPEEVDEWNRDIQDRVVQEGTAMISSTRIDGAFSLRICPMNWRTTEADVDAVIDRVEALAFETTPRG
ncbi:MAG: hypothetical protein RQ745_09460, partial [Longimicrobiales bacterium]|nr:hypothetical protein [Longimicrobiales bacterium]